MSAILHRNFNQQPPLAVRGEGLYLYDAMGRAYLDASGGAAVSSLGHSHPAVIQAVRQQIGTLSFAHTSFFSNTPAETLAQRLIERAPAGFGAGRVAFVGSGSEAMEAALKLARQHFVEKGEPKRTRFIARRMSYHGNTLGALAVGNHPDRRSIYEPLLMSSSFVSPCYPYRQQRSDETGEAYASRLAQELNTQIEQLGAENVAAFVLEPVAGATLGSVPPVASYLQQIRKVCDRHGVLLIADEVMCGMGRCGAYFVSGQETVTPDLITIAKGLAAGYQPIGAVLASGSVIAPIARGTGVLAHGHTYMSHPVACATALAVLESVEQDGLLDCVRARGAVLETRLRAAFANHPYVGDIRGRGLLWGIELVRNRDTKESFDPSLGLARRIKSTAQDLGLICYPSAGASDGGSSDHVLLAPPFIIQDEQLDELVDKLTRAVDWALDLALRAGRS